MVTDSWNILEAVVRSLLSSEGKGIAKKNWKLGPNPQICTPTKQEVDRATHKEEIMAHTYFSHGQGE